MPLFTELPRRMEFSGVCMLGFARSAPLVAVLSLMQMGEINLGPKSYRYLLP